MSVMIALPSKRSSQVQLLFQGILPLVSYASSVGLPTCGVTHGVVLFFTSVQALSQKFAMGVWGRSRRRPMGVWGQSPQRSKILYFFAKITSF